MTLGKIERFWKTIWEEFLSEAMFASFADACQRLDHWIHYYNHQRPHQGIDGATPADRFYGMAEDVEEALKQGCEENALRLALGQEPQPPLYLLGQLGGVDVRVVRKGEDIEVKVGDAVHEVIRMGAPFTIGEDGTFGRARQVDQASEVDGALRPGALPGGDAGTAGRREDPSAVPDLRREPADAAPGYRSGGCGVDGGVGAEEAGSQADAGIGSASEGTYPIQQRPAEGAGSLEDEVRGGQDLHRPGAAVGPADFLEWRERKKTPEAEEEEELNGSEASCWPRENRGDGPRP